jgi:hypothetical protein
MAAVTRTVQEDGGGDYTTLAAAITTSPSGADDLTVNIEETWDAAEDNGSTLAISTWNSVTINVTGAARHPGYLNETTGSHYRIYHDGGDVIQANVATTIDGLVLKQFGLGASDEGIHYANAGTNTIRDSILCAASEVEDQDGLYSFNQSVTVNVENCIAYGWGRGGINCQLTGAYTATWNINSFTAWNCGDDGSQFSGKGGIVAWPSHASSTLNYNVFNSVAVDCSAGLAEDYSLYTSSSGTDNWDIHNSIDSDNTIASRDASAVGCLASRTATDTASPGAGDWVIFQDITTALPNVDLRLQDNSTDNDAQEMHSTSSGAGLTIPTNDFLDVARAAPYDCGAHEIPAAGVVAPTGALEGPLIGALGGPIG